jgi:DNA polymerase III delta prime subunit
LWYNSLMKQIRDTYKKTGKMHHAYGIFGDREKVRNELTVFLEKDLKFPITGNSDFWQGDFNVFKIADSRSLNEAHLNKPVEYDRKIFVVFANFITKDAQNSLLKIFEEPRADTTFFLVLPEATDLLSTFKSRLIISQLSEKKADLLESAEEFLKAKIGKRLEIISKITKDIKDEKKTKSDAITFIKNIEKVIKENRRSNKSKGGQDKSLLAVEDIEKAISYAGDESPSIKVILEHLALVL